MENLKIRRFEEKDRDDMFNNWTSDEEVARYMLYPLHKTIELINKYEGWVLKFYKYSSRVWTMGYGHFNEVKSGMRISKAQALDYLKQDLSVLKKQ